MTTDVQSVPHLPTGLDAPVYECGPLSRRAVAGLLAEIADRARVARLRPDVCALTLADDTALLYVRDTQCSAHLLLVMLDHHATPAAWPVASGSAWLESAGLVRLWAEKPTRGAEMPAAELLCRACGEPNREPAPGRAGATHCRSCWHDKVLHGRRQQLAQERAWLEREAAA